MARARSCARQLYPSAFAVGLAACASEGVADAPPTTVSPGVLCEPADTWEVLRASSAGDPTLIHLGDPSPATAEQVGDGLYHLFVGVMTGDMDEPRGRVFDATSATPEGPYALEPTPLIDETDPYDEWGIETPSYLRADEHTEYLYYCGLHSSYTSGPGAWVSALKRVDGGPWTKLGRVAPELSGGWSQCEPDVAFDPDTGQFVMILQEATADGTGEHYGLLVARTSPDPEHFPPESTVDILWDDGLVLPIAPAESPAPPKRPTLSRDPHAGVWRFSWDLNYFVPHHAIQSWSATAIPARTELEANAASLHLGDHGLHSDIHLDTTDPEDGGWVGMPSTPLYLDEDTLLYFYAGWGDAAELRVHAQRCRRR